MSAHAPLCRRKAGKAGLAHRRTWSAIGMHGPMLDSLPHKPHKWWSMLQPASQRDIPPRRPLQRAAACCPTCQAARPMKLLCFTKHACVRAYPRNLLGPSSTCREWSRGNTACVMVQHAQHAHLACRLQASRTCIEPQDLQRQVPSLGQEVYPVLALLPCQVAACMPPRLDVISCSHECDQRRRWCGENPA